MTSKSTGNALSALPTHKVEYAVQKRRPVMLPRRSSTSLNAKTSAKVNRDIKRNVSKRLNDNLDAKFHENTELRGTKDTQKENRNHRLKSCSRKIVLKEFSQGDVAQNKRNLRNTKFIFNRGSLPVGISKNLHSGSGIKPLMISDNRLIKSLSASRNRSVINALFTESKDQNNTPKRDCNYKAFTNRSIKQPALRSQPENILKIETRNTLLPTDELRKKPSNDTHTTNYNTRSGDQWSKLHQATFETSVVKLKSFSQYQVKQKYKRSSINLKPFSLFFKKTLSDNLSSVQVDVSSTVKCTKKEAFLHEKQLPNSDDLSSLYENNVVDLSPKENRSSVLLKKSSGKKCSILRECKTGACIAKGCNPSICSRKNVCQLKAESKKNGKSPASFTTFHIKQVDSKSLREQNHCKKTHRLVDKQIYNNESIEPLELSSPLKRKVLICNSQYNTSKQKRRNDKNISLRTCQMNPQQCSDRNNKIDSHKSLEYNFVKDYNDNKAVCLRHYIKSSKTKNTAINITSSFNLRIDVSNGHKTKKPEYKNKPIIRTNILSLNKDGPTALNKMAEPSSISLIRAVYSKLFPITNTRKKEKKPYKEVPASRKISVNKRNQNKDSPTNPIDKQVPDGKSKTIKVQGVENNSIFKRCFCFLFNKLTKDRLGEPDNLKKINSIESRNINKKSGYTNLTEYNLLESRDFSQRKKIDSFKKIKTTNGDRNIIKKQDILNSTKTAFDNIGCCALPIYTEYPIEKLSVSNKYEIPNCHKFLSRSDFNLSVEFHKDFHKSKEFNTKLKRHMIPAWISNHSLYNRGVQKKYTDSPIVMSLQHKTKYTNNKSETSNTKLGKMKTFDNIFKIKSQNNDDTIALYEHHDKNFKATSNISILKLNPIFEENKTSFKNYQHTEPKKLSLIQCERNYAQHSYEYVNRNKEQTNQTKYYFPGGKLCMGNNNLSKSELLELYDGKWRENTANYYSAPNNSIKLSSNKFSRYNKPCQSKSRVLISQLSSKPRKIDSGIKESASAKIGKIENYKVLKTQEKNKITAAYCHVTYDRAGNATCERDITCAPQCDWITKKGKRVQPKAHVIDNFCPFEDGNFMIQPCVIENQENKDKRGKKTIDTITKNKCNFFKNCLDKKKCHCVCSKGDALVSEKKNPNTNIMPKLSIAVDCDTMNIKNREEVLKKVIKLRDQEGESLSQERNKAPCCCTGSKHKSLRCMSCTNIPNRPIMKQIVTMKNMENDPPLEIKMDSDSNILNRKELIERIKKMKENESLQGKAHTDSGNDTIVNIVKNKLTGKPVCVCKDEVCSRASEEEYMRKSEAAKKEKEKPCVCGAPSCEKVTIQRLMKEGKLSKKDGKVILAMIKKQEQIQKKEELRKQRKKVFKERKKIREQHMKEKKKGDKKKKHKKLTAKNAMQGKLTKKELKQLPKDQRELVEQSAKKESVAQKETKKIKKAMEKQKKEDAERKAKEEMQERQQAADLEMKFKRQMLADERREKKDLRKKQFAERIKRAKEGRIKKMETQKRKKQLELKKEKRKLKERIEDEELKKQKEKQEIELAEKERVHREKEARRKKKEKMQQEKLQMKKRDQALKLKLLKEKKKRAAILKKKKEKEKKRKLFKIQKENKRFLKEMGKIAAAERKKQKKEAERKHQLKLQRHEFMRTEMKKYKDADDRYLVIESLKEAGACCVKYTGKFFDYLMYSAKHPKLTYKKIRRAYLQPGEVATELQKSWSESDVHDIANRIEAKILALDQLYPIGKKIYEKPKKKRPPKRRFKKRKRNRRAPMDFGCSLYMASLRRKPYFFLYWMCPWFYPHLISMLKVLRQIADLGLFILAIFVWSPFILLWECFRTIMCCGLCTA